MPGSPESAGLLPARSVGPACPRTSVRHHCLTTVGRRAARVRTEAHERCFSLRAQLRTDSWSACFSGTSWSACFSGMAGAPAAALLPCHREVGSQHGRSPSSERLLPPLGRSPGWQPVWDGGLGRLPRPPPGQAGNAFSPAQRLWLQPAWAGADRMAAAPELSRQSQLGGRQSRPADQRAPGCRAQVQLAVRKRFAFRRVLVFLRELLSSDCFKDRMWTFLHPRVR